MENLSIGVTIGAAIGSAFHNSVSTADKKLHKIGDTVKKISNERSKFKPFERAEANLDAARKKLQDANQSVIRLKSDMAKQPSPALSKALLKAEKAAQKAATAFDKQHVKTQKIKADMRANGIEVGNYRKEVDRLGKSLEQAQQKQTALAKRVQMKNNIAQERANYRSQALDAVALGMTISAPIKVAVEFEQSIAKLGSITSSTQEEMTALSNTAKKLGSSTQFSASQSAEAMTYLGMAGFKTNQIMEATPGLLDLATAAGSDLGSTADIASNILSGMGLEANQMGRVGDVLSSTFSSSNTTLEMLGETMKYVAPNAAGLGVSLEEVAALSGKLGDVGIQGSQAGTALRAAMIRLAKPPKAAADALKELGVSVKDENGNFIGMTETLKQLEQATSNLSNTDKLAAITNIFGTEAASAMNELTKQAGSGALDEYIAKLESANGRAGDMANKMSQTTSGAFKAFGSAMEGLSITLGETLLPALTSLTTVITKGIKVVTEFAQANPTLTTALVGLGTGLIGVKVATIGLGYAFTFIKGGILGFTGLLSALKAGALALAPVFPAVAAGIKTIGLALAANPISLLVAGIAAGAVAIYTYWEPISGFFQSVFNDIKTAISPYIDTIKTVFGFSPIGLLVNNFESIKSFFGGLVTDFGSLGGDIIDGLIGGIKSKFDSAVSLVSELGKSISSGFKSVLGIESPSKVMISAGQDTASGIEVGLTKGEQGVQSQMGKIAKTIAGTTLVASTITPAVASPTSNQFPALGDMVPTTANYTTLQSEPTAFSDLEPKGIASNIAWRSDQTSNTVQQKDSSNTVFNQTFSITVNAAAGADPQQIAQQVIEQIQRDTSESRRNAMGDWA